MARREAGKAATALLAEHLQPDLFKVLCDPTRLMLIARLAISSEPLTVTEATECCGVHISGTSRHLALLKAAGIVEAQRRGREVAYRLVHDRLINTLRGLAIALEQCRDRPAAGAATACEGGRQ